jgi:HlyD family secretion protein
VPPLRPTKRLWALFALALPAAAVAWYFVAGRAVETYTAAHGSLAQSVVANGQVITPQRASIAAEVTARVERVPVAQGDTVRRGQVLIELDRSDELAAVEQARAALAQAEAKLAQIEKFTLPSAQQALAQARANHTQAQAAYQRTADLVAKNFVARAQLDDAQRNLDVAASQVRAAELGVQTNDTGGSDRVLAQTGRTAALAALAVAQTKLDATVIRAPADGVLIARSVEPGTVAQAGKELMVIAPAGETQVVVNIDEKNLGKLAVGQHALVSADAFPGQSFPAELFYINPGIDPARGAVAVKLRVPQPPAYLRQDMSVSVDIEVGRRDGVLAVPANAVHDAGTAHPWVLAVREGKAVRQPVVLGMRGDTAIEIREGVAEHEALVPATNALVAAGDRVRATPMHVAGK